MKLFFLLFLTPFNWFYAQSSFNSSSANTSGSGGSVTSSYGEVFYRSSSDPSYTISEGVQQAFQITTLGIDGHEYVNIELEVYPNPTNSILYLKFSDQKNYLSKYELFDASGKLLRSEKIRSIDTSIDMASYPSASYILRILQDGQTIKTFKIIKK